MSIRNLLCFSLLFYFFIACKTIAPPVPYGPTPSYRQLTWHELEFYAFVHFNMNTFSNMEWGYGDEDPALFNPTQLDTRQWVQLAKKAGMKGIILTAKHHDGFCLWPSAYTEHSVKNSPWKNGKGDVIKDLAEACQEYGLRMGLYLSPWDRNHAQYGTQEYVEYFHNQLRELLSNYGDVFEVWFDGANGGDGYYGGARETRKIDNKTYYQWDKAIAIIRELQPDACIFGDGGPEVRWVGNEEGWANETNWSLIRKKEVYPGYAKYVELRSGHEDGTHWVPAECDVSIRPGWYYHPYEDHKVKSLAHLVDIYYESIGRNASLLLNLPVDNRGIVHEKDAEQLLKLAETIRKDFAHNLAAGKSVTASETRGNNHRYTAKNVTDNNKDTYWTTNDHTRAARLEVDLGSEMDINRILLQEYIPLGQRVKKYTLESFHNNSWEPIDTGTTIGYKRIFRFPTRKASKIRINIMDAKACPVISNLEIFKAPVLVAPPIIERDREGNMTMRVVDNESQIHYTTDGSMPTSQSPVYQKDFLIINPTLVQAISFDKHSGTSSEVVRQEFDIAKKDWKVVSVMGATRNEASKIIDEKITTVFRSKKSGLPHETVVDLGAVYNLKGFSYLPMQDRWISGIVTHYEFFVSENGQDWGDPVVHGEFSNIRNNPILQRILFPEKTGRFIKFRALKTMDDIQDHITIAELGIISK